MACRIYHTTEAFLQSTQQVPVVNFFLTFFSQVLYRFFKVLEVRLVFSKRKEKNKHNLNVRRPLAFLFCPFLWETCRIALTVGALDGMQASCKATQII